MTGPPILVAPMTLPDSSPRGVLLGNVGSPDAPTPAAVRRFLAEFLGDRDVIGLPRALWLPFLHGAVLPLRSRSSAALYAKIWTDEGSPLQVNAARTAAALQDRLGDGWVVEVGMRYGAPSLAAGIESLAHAGCESVVLAPLFPQAAEATWGSIVKAALPVAARSGLSMATLPLFHEDRAWMDAVADGIRPALAEGDAHLVLSFHGLPLSAPDAQVYRARCEASAAGIVSRLGLDDVAWTLVFQSRFGPARWLGPMAAEAVPALAALHSRVVVACPGFAADCLETLEEIGIRLAKAFLAAGGESLALSPCLNDDPAWIAALADLIQQAAAASPTPADASP